MSAPADAVHALVHPEVQAYLASLDPPAEPLLDALEAYAHARGFPLVGRASGRWLELLSRTIGARRVLELGSGFGYSAYFFARAVGEGGEVLCTEKDAHELEAADRLWGDHPLRARLRWHLGSALDTLAALDGDFDVVFVDLAKRDYPAALDAAVPRLRHGGLLLADNVLWGGKVTRPGDPDTEALRAFNRRLHADPRLDAAILPVGDGLAVARRR